MIEGLQPCRHYIIFPYKGEKIPGLFSLHRNYREAEVINEKYWCHMDKNRTHIQPFLQPFRLMGNMLLCAPYDWVQRLDLIYLQPIHFPKGTVNYQCETEKMLITWAKLCSCLFQNNTPDCSCFCVSLALSPQFPGLSLNRRNSALRQLLGQSLMAGKSTVLQTLRHCKY